MLTSPWKNLAVKWKLTITFLLVAFALSLSAATAASAVPALEEVGFAARLEGGVNGFPLFGGRTKVEAALGSSCAIALVSAELPALPLLDAVVTGSLALPHDWITAAIGISHEVLLSRTNVSFTVVI